MLACRGCACLDKCVPLLRVCISMSPNAVCWRALVGAGVASVMEIVLEMQSSLMVRVCSCSDITRKGLIVRLSSFLYVSFAIAMEECVAAVGSEGHSMNATPPSRSERVTCTNSS